MFYNTNVNEINSNQNYRIENTVAATQDSVFINIIMEGHEETIALHRSIGTDPDDNQLTLEKEALLETVINITKEENFCDEINLDLDNLEKVQSNTIFLYGTKFKLLKKNEPHKVLKFDQVALSLIFCI